MRTWWSSRCIKSSTLAWRRCFFILRLRLHSPNQTESVLMGAESFTKKKLTTKIHDLLSTEWLTIYECQRPVIHIQYLPLDSLLLFTKSYVWNPMRSSGVSKTFVRKRLERTLCSFWKG
jgi:hypothetical protein